MGLKMLYLDTKIFTYEKFEKIRQRESKID